jgi:tetratricopeptide (TPR) repeat protein
VIPRRAERRPLAPEPRAAAPVAPAGARDEWTALNNGATDDLAAGEIDQALEKFERCRAARPENPVFTGNLAEALVRAARLSHERGELEAAVRALARAVELGVEREDHATLERILSRWRDELELGSDDWKEESGRFELAFDTDRADILHRSHEVLEHLERSYDELVRWFGIDPLAGGPPIRVALYDPEDFDRLTGLGDWAAGLFDGVVRVSVPDLAGEGWRAVLVHELVHAFAVGIAGTRVPGWLNEGLAQALEGGPRDAALLRARLRGKALFTLEELSGTLADWQDPAAIALAYAESFLFVGFLRATYGDEALRRTVLGIGAGLPPGEAFRRFTGVDLGAAFGDWSSGL